MTSKSGNIRKWTGILLFGFGVLLVLAQTTDSLVPPVADRNRPQTGIAGYDFHTLSLNEFRNRRAILKLQRNLADDEGADPWRTAQEVNELVSQAIRHDDSIRIRLGENWIQWIGGIFYPPLAWPQQPDQILDRQAGICSDACGVLLTELQELSIPARIVGLSGHVVIEIQLGERWQMLDPDFGITSDHSVSEIATDSVYDAQGFGPAWNQVADRLTQRGFSAKQIENYRLVVGSQNDNYALAVNQPLNPRLRTFTLLTRWLSPLLALLLILMGIAILRASRTQTSNET